MKLHLLIGKDHLKIALELKLLRAALEEDLPLYGPELVECFQASCKENAFRGFREHELASRKIPYFQARHAMLLGREDVEDYNKYFLYTERPIKAWEELTVKYTFYKI